MAPQNNKSFSARKTETVFFDDFHSGQLDRTKWNVRVSGRTVNNEQQAYLDSAETIYIAESSEGNFLVLHPRYRPGYLTPEGDHFDFVSGRLDTREKVEFTYGIVSARMKLPAGKGLWPAFWALGTGKWPESGEIDIMENVGEPDWVSAAVHGPNFSGENGLVNNKYFSSENDATRWHTYSVDWSPERLEFFVDEQIVYRVTRPMVEFAGEWVFDNPKYLILNLALGGTFPFKVNGIQTPYYGMAAETVEMIKKDEVKVFVDWVQVRKWVP